MKPEKIIPQVFTFRKIKVLRIEWQQGKAVKLNNEENKQLDPGG